MATNERGEQLIKDAKWNSFFNTLTNTLNEGKSGMSGNSYLNLLESIVGTNGTPTTSSGTPTVNTSGVRNYGGNNLVRENGKVVYNPGNFNWGYDNLRGTYNQNNQTYRPFSVADTLAQRAQGYQAQGLEGLANSYKTLNKENNIYNNTANKITDYYTQLANDINSRENALAQRKESLANQLSQDIANQRQYVMDYFGPNGIFTNELNKYYDENGNYLASEAGRQMAMANAEGIQSGASLGAQRAARNEAYNNAFQNYLKVKEQEIAAKMQIQQQLINYMQSLRQEYGDTQNQFVISQYERANNLLNTISQSLADSQSNIALSKLQQALKGSGSSSQAKIIADAFEAVAKGTATPEQKYIASANYARFKDEAIPYYLDNGEWNFEDYPIDRNSNNVPALKTRRVVDWDNRYPGGANIDWSKLASLIEKEDKSEEAKK